MGNRQYVLLAPRRCEGCGELFQPQRRNQTYHHQACKQKGSSEPSGPYCRP